MNDAFIFNLERLAQRSIDTDSSIYELCGGNYDDAYSIGCDVGETLLAREILTELGISYE